MLARRVERLEETRAGAVDVQEADLRRIERDLHDGAQARLVALGMSLGRAEQKLDADPDAARELVAEARVGVGGGAARAARPRARDPPARCSPTAASRRPSPRSPTAARSRSPCAADVDPRPASAVETAAYFVVAEALTNAAKHAAADAGRRAAPAPRRRARRRGRRTTASGGADPAGGGLTGLRRRVEALDGTLP